MNETRAKAWETRRQKYGLRGHGGSYRTGKQAPSCAACQRMIPLLIDLHLSEILSEGQVAKATGLDRVEIRKLCDEWCACPFGNGGSVHCEHRGGALCRFNSQSSSKGCQ